MEKKMKNQKKTKKKIIIEGIMLFIGIMVTIFIIGQMFLSPMLEKVYWKGYNQGKEECDGFSFENIRENQTLEGQHSGIVENYNFTFNYS